MSEVTCILLGMEQGDPHASEQLLPLVYDELRKLAAEKMAQERPGQTLEATALVHEAYVRLANTGKVQHWENRRHFFAAAAEQSNGLKKADSQPDAGEDACFNRTLRFYQRFVDANRGLSDMGTLVEKVQREVLTGWQDRLRQSPHVLGYRRALAAATVNMALLLESAGRAEEAEKTYAQALSVQQPLLDGFPMVAEYRDELAGIHDRLTELLLSHGQDRRAEQHRTAAERARLAARTAMPAKPPAPLALARLHRLGSASLEGDRLRLTPAAPACAGAAWTAEKQLVALGFDSVFTFRLSGGADGFGFVIQNDGISSLAGAGCALSYGDGPAHAGGIPNSLAVEFDTMTNGEHADLAGSHISVQTNGAGRNSAHHAFSLGAAGVDFDDGKAHTARIRYVPGTLTVFIDHSTQPVLVAPAELSATLRLDRGRAWVGFTAGTGDAYQTHDILSWEYYPLVDPDTADSLFRRHLANTGDGSEPTAVAARREGGAHANERPRPTIRPSSTGCWPFIRRLPRRTGMIRVRCGTIRDSATLCERSVWPSTRSGTTSSSRNAGRPSLQYCAVGDHRDLSRRNEQRPLP